MCPWCFLCLWTPCPDSVAQRWAGRAPALGLLPAHTAQEHTALVICGAVANKGHL